MPPSLLTSRQAQTLHAHTLPPSAIDAQEMPYTRKCPTSRFCLERSNQQFCEDAKRYKDYDFDPDTGLWINKK